MSIGCILLAGGKSSRMKSSLPKPFIELSGKSVLQYSLDLFKSIEVISEIVVVCPLEYRHLVKDHEKFALPGERRQDSVSNGISELTKNPSFVLIHDGARPLLVKSDVLSLITIGSLYPGAALAGPIRSTLKNIDKVHNVRGTLNREEVMEAYTPQIFPTKLLKESNHLLNNREITFTDDLSLVEYLGMVPKLIPTEYPNIKITYQSDLLWVKALLPLFQENQEMASATS